MERPPPKGVELTLVRCGKLRPGLELICSDNLGLAASGRLLARLTKLASRTEGGFRGVVMRAGFTQVHLGRWTPVPSTSPMQYNIAQAGISCMAPQEHAVGLLAIVDC